MLKGSRLAVSLRLQVFSRRFSVLFFGTDDFSLPSLKKLSNENFSRLEVVTSYKAVNNPVKKFAELKGLKMYDWKFLTAKENLEPICREFDMGLVVSFGHLIPEQMIECFQLGMLNVHASLLPKYRGASPIIYAIRNGDIETGVTIMKIKPKKFDVGDILAYQRMQIHQDMLMPELHSNLSSIGADLLVDCVKNLEDYKPIEQDNSKASYAPKIDIEFCEVRWREMTALQVYNLYRSIYSFKNIQTTFRQEPVKLIEIAVAKVDVSDSLRNLEAGSLTFCRKTRKLLVKCADDNFIEIKQISIGKKKAMSAADFNNGFLKKCDASEKKFS